MSGAGLPGGPDIGNGRRAPPARLKQRSDFLRAAGGGRVHGRCLSLQAYRRKPGEDSAAGSRVGLTVTKKVGDAVERNRIKRRLREALRTPTLALEADHDYVIVARRDALAAPFTALVGEVGRCFADAAARRTKPGRPRPPAGAGPRRGRSGPPLPPP